MRYVVFLMILCAFGACKSKKGLESVGCSNIGTVKNFSELDGCGYLIILESNGDRLNPVKFPTDNFKLEDGLRVKFDYKVVTDQASTCMSESFMVEVTCIETYGSGFSAVESNLQNTSPNLKECINTTSPAKVKWMNTAVKQHNPFEVVKYDYRTDGWAYYFKGMNSYLYDCQGNLLCETPGKSLNQCARRVSELEKATPGKVIWERNG